jgi:hypothetical protein
VLAQVAGALRPAEVLHAGPHAAYLRLGDVCLGVLAARAARLPCGIRTSLPTLPTVEPGCVATVGRGSVELPGLELAVRPGSETTVPRLTGLNFLEAPALDGVLLARALERLCDVRDCLPGPALAALAAGDSAAVPALLGLGPGLTPLGDDVLAGWLAAALATAHPGLRTVRDAVRSLAPARTTTLSATLLEAAARGEAVPELVDLLQGLDRTGTVDAGRSLERLLGIGGTSGRGLAYGALLAITKVPEWEA